MTALFASVDIASAPPPSVIGRAMAVRRSVRQCTSALGCTPGTTTGTRPPGTGDSDGRGTRLRGAPAPGRAGQPSGGARGECGENDQRDAAHVYSGGEDTSRVIKTVVLIPVRDNDGRLFPKALWEELQGRFMQFGG